MPIESAADSVIPDTNRKVWVVNTHTETHKEEFRGKTVEVPPNGEKKLLMPYLAARRFLAQVTPLGEKLPNGQWKTPPKMLQTVELTPAERKVIDGISPDDLAKNANAVEEALKLQCQICLFQAKDARGLKIHMTKEHGDQEPLTDPTPVGAMERSYPGNADIEELASLDEG